MQFKDVLSRTHLCKQLGVSRSTIKRWIQTRNFPKPLQSSGREPLFDRNKVEYWLSNGESRND